MVPKLLRNDFDKCAICSQAKITKSSHKYAVRNSRPLNLIHSDLCKFDGVLTRNNQIYFIIFVDYCYDYTSI